MKIFIAASLLACKIINGSLLVFNLIVNIFYTFCLIFPTDAGQRKQPLTLLLGYLIFCSLSYCVCFATACIYASLGKYSLIFGCITNYSVDYSMVSYVWLNFYYYIQIVPPPFALLRWVKRNIKSTVYVLLCIDILITILCKISVYVFLILQVSTGVISNATSSFSLQQSSIFSFYMTMMHYAMMSCVSAVSTLSTVCYLYKHMKNMGKMCTSISAARLRGQMRVTITGMFQGVFFFLHAIYLLFDGFVSVNSDFFLDVNIRYTFTSCFIYGTTVTLGIGQNVFRKRIVEMYKALKQTLWS